MTGKPHILWVPWKTLGSRFHLLKSPAACNGKLTSFLKVQGGNSAVILISLVNKLSEISLLIAIRALWWVKTPSAPIFTKYTRAFIFSIWRWMDWTTGSMGVNIIIANFVAFHLKKYIWEFCSSDVRDPPFFIPWQRPPNLSKSMRKHYLLRSCRNNRFSFGQLKILHPQVKFCLHFPEEGYAWIAPNSMIAATALLNIVQLLV